MQKPVESARAFRTRRRHDPTPAYLPVVDAVVVVVVFVVAVVSVVVHTVVSNGV